MDFRNRILGLEYIHSRDLDSHPGNWRDHPKPQVEALRGVLAEVGVAGAAPGSVLGESRCPTHVRF